MFAAGRPAEAFAVLHRYRKTVDGDPLPDQLVADHIDGGPEIVGSITGYVDDLAEGTSTASAKLLRSEQQAARYRSPGSVPLMEPLRCWPRNLPRRSSSRRSSRDNHSIPAGISPLDVCERDAAVSAAADCTYDLRLTESTGITLSLHVRLIDIDRVGSIDRKYKLQVDIDRFCGSRHHRGLESNQQTCRCQERPSRPSLWRCGGAGRCV